MVVFTQGLLKKKPFFVWYLQFVKNKHATWEEGSPKQIKNHLASLGLVFHTNGKLNIDTSQTKSAMTEVGRF